MAKKPTGLGKGIDNILFDNSVEEKGGITKLRISMIEPKADQPRRVFEGEALAELADSISAHGVLQPILVREIADGHYQIIAGERRYRASKMAGLTEVPVIILDKDDLETAEISLIENIQREDLNPIEEAKGYRALIESFNLTQEEVSLRVGKGRSTITNALRLLDLSDDVIAMLNAGELSAGHARALLALKDKAKEVSVAARIVAQGLSVRVTEDMVRKENKLTQKAETDGEEVPEIGLEIDYYEELAKKAMELIGRRVKISHKGVVKTVSVTFEDNEDLEILLKKLCGDEIIE
ncbi:MAG: ParB/RepB/Spo0J family partition protein [Ruminococcaceae bacterium]|nr:ParB/RepB/Spo0J family partition protein [Oscillospiraceae bacterium]